MYYQGSEFVLMYCKGSEQNELLLVALIVLSSVITSSPFHLIELAFNRVQRTQNLDLLFLLLIHFVKNAQQTEQIRCNGETSPQPLKHQGRIRQSQVISGP